MVSDGGGAPEEGGDTSLNTCLMEDGLGPLSAAFITSFLGLNPCFYGGWSRTDCWYAQRFSTTILNPCFNGRWSRTLSDEGNEREGGVLILVLMEDGLGRQRVGNYPYSAPVLILVLMEDGLGQEYPHWYVRVKES